MPVSKQRRKTGNAGPAAASGGGNTRTWVLTGLGVAILFGGALWYLTGGGSGVQVDVTVPPLTGAAVKGEQVFNANWGTIWLTYHATIPIYPSSTKDKGYGKSKSRSNQTDLPQRERGTETP